MPHERSSRIPGLYKLPVEARLERVQAFADLTEDEVDLLRGADPERLALADRMIENVAGLFHLPVGFAANFRIDGVDRLLPMVIEEPSVVAASSNAAKLMRQGDGIATSATDPVMIGQIQLCDVPDHAAARAAIEAQAERLVALANDSQPRLVARGGGARALTVRELPDTPAGPMLVVHLLVDVCEAMGANLVNAMAELLAPECEALSGGEATLRILSNLADQRRVQAVGRIPLAWLARPDLGMDGAAVADRLVRASAFAEADPYRATTHNKGIMNGVDALLLATGQDWRAVEAGAHAYAARDGRYTALATWRREGDFVVGRIDLPMQVGLVGGVTKVHPVVRVNLKVVGAENATELGRFAAAAGLAQNLAAILALATEGIQRGHMSLHARNIAAAVGAEGAQIDQLVAEMIRRRTFSHTAAETILREGLGPAAPVPADVPPADSLVALRETYWPQIEQVFAKVIPPPAPGDTDSFEAMVWYQLGTGGKRLRATIPLALYQASGRDPKDIVPLAAALEMLHNATLTHDDAERRLRERRGRETIWVRYGLDQAINVGDGMFYASLRCLELLPHPPARTQRLVSAIMAHMTEVVRGQIAARRVNHEAAPGAVEHGDARLLEVLRDRIGGLFKLAVLSPGVLVGAEPDTVERLTRIGEHLGAIFQIQDDLLDIVGGAAGQRRGASLAEGRLNVLTGHLVTHAPPEAAEALRAILAKPPIETSAADVSRAAMLLEQHGSIQFGLDLLDGHRERLVELVAGLRAELRGVLLAMVDLVLAPLHARVEPPADEP